MEDGVIGKGLGRVSGWCFIRIDFFVFGNWGSGNRGLGRIRSKELWVIFFLKEIVLKRCI